MPNLQLTDLKNDSMTDPPFRVTAIVDIVQDLIRVEQENGSGTPSLLLDLRVDREHPEIAASVAKLPTNPLVLV